MPDDQTPEEIVVDAPTSDDADTPIVVNADLPAQPPAVEDVPTQLDGGTAAVGVTPQSQILIPPVEVIDSAESFAAVNSRNLDELFEFLSVIAPIVGISGIGDDMQYYRIDFADTATDEQKSRAEAALPQWPQLRETVRLHKYNLQQLDEWFAAQIEAGCPTSAGFTLSLTANDVALLTGSYVLAKAAAELGMPLPPIVDKTGQPHYLPDLASLTQIMLEYGQYRAGLSVVYAARKAETMHALNSLTLPPAQ